MAYTFENLSFADFEDLARDLLGQELGVRFEGFGAGPDGGIDGRHAVAEKTMVLQAKHYAGSPFAALKSVMAKSRSTIDALKPARYLLATSRSLTPGNKVTLAREIGPALLTQSDIFGPTDLNGLLRKFGVPTDVLERTVAKIEERISEISEATDPASSPSLSADAIKEVENFDDNALRNLFAPLINGMR